MVRFNGFVWSEKNRRGRPGRSHQILASGRQTMPGFPRLRESYEIAVLGGGHAGLQAGLKAALLRRSAAIVDRGPKYSRSYYAPRMANIPGFPEGISGHALLDRQIAQVRAQEEWAGYFTPAQVESVTRREGGFTIEFHWLKKLHRFDARAVVLALGVVDRMPEIGGAIEPLFPWANQGIVDFCLLCDGHELAGKSIAVFGHDAYAARTALDLFEFDVARVDLVTNGRSPWEGVPPEEAETLKATLDERGIGWITPPITAVGGIREKRLDLHFGEAGVRSYDRGFSALGWYTQHSEIPRSLGCRLDAEGYVVSDEDSRAIEDATGEPIPGLYVAGDLRSGWNQIPEAWATAERAVIHAFTSYL